MKQSTYTSYNSNVEWLKKGLFLAVFGGFGLLIWFAASNSDTLDADDAEIPLVRADQSPVKVRAENPGGMDVPNRDKRVFDLLSSVESENLEDKGGEQKPCEKNGAEFTCGNSLPKIEELAPVSPVQKVQNIPTNAREDSIASLIESSSGASTSTEKEATKELVQPLKNAPKKVDNNLPEKVVEPTTEFDAKDIPVTRPSKSVEGKTEKMAPKNDVKLSKESKASGGYGVQLGSYGSLSGANRSEKIYRKNLGVLISDLSYVTQTVDVKGKTYYRVRFMGLKSKTEAQSLCKKIKTKKQGCWHAKN